MIRLFENDSEIYERQSSKGNQLKWYCRGVWYKADYMGYEGLTEYMASRLLEKSSLEKGEYVSYDTEEIVYGKQNYLGCKSRNFLKEKQQLITLERLLGNLYGESFYKMLYKLTDVGARLRFLAEKTEEMTGLDSFGIYLSKLLVMDGLFLNEDRHLHNIAVIRKEDGQFEYCPFFDNGAGLLSDIRMEYPMGEDIFQLMETVRAKTICSDFDEQIEAAEALYGQQIWFQFGEKEVQRFLDEEPYYPAEYKKRLFEIIMNRRRKYRYLFRG